MMAREISRTVLVDFLELTPDGFKDSQRELVWYKDQQVYQDWQGDDMLDVIKEYFRINEPNAIVDSISWQDIVS